ncbi:hypothetical protein H9P43_007009 [Blastocladiella emersonii ATCC 22665]|nr:hypothetical protein H9P43_007009 [Blastocladiella emersonii ATCC 22665]
MVSGEVSDSDAARVTPLGTQSPGRVAPCRTSNYAKYVRDNLEGYQVEALNQVNAWRATQGSGAVCLNAMLNEAAQVQADDMARHSRLEHTGTDGRDPFQRIRAAGYEHGAASENIAYGYISAGYGGPTPAINAWKKSAGHAKNMRSTAVSQMGLAYAVGACPNNRANQCGFWAQVFASNNKGYPCSSQADNDPKPAPEPKPEPPKPKPKATNSHEQHYEHALFDSETMAGPSPDSEEGSMGRTTRQDA